MNKMTYQNIKKGNQLNINNGSDTEAFANPLLGMTSQSPRFIQEK